MEVEKLENLLVERLCRRNGWEHPEDCDNAVRDVKWFLAQPEIFKAGEDKGKQEGQEEEYKRWIKFAGMAGIVLEQPQQLKRIIPQIKGNAREEGFDKVVEFVENERHSIGRSAQSYLNIDRWQAFLKKSNEMGFTEEELKDLRHNASDDTIG